MKIIFEYENQKKENICIFFYIKSGNFVGKKNNINPISKEGAISLNNIFMLTLSFTILLGTIYPIIIEVLTNKRISVGGPYFNSTVIPIMIPGFLLMSIAPILTWQSNKIRNARMYVIGFITLSIIILLQ